MRHTIRIVEILGQSVAVLSLSTSLAVGNSSASDNRTAAVQGLIDRSQLVGSSQSGSSSSSSSGGSPSVTYSSASPSPKNWSAMGVVADGVTDNTAALNALPASVSIVGDCPAGKAIVVKGRWIWHSNLNISIQAGCTIDSYVTGGGKAPSYAITQADLNYPLTNIYVSGLQISSYHAASEDTILKLWVNNLTLLHWTVTASEGVMVVRGSNQEIAYGKATGTFPATGNPGIRHVGNEPKVATSAGRPANVYIHDNYVQSGDGAYQVCQPLQSLVWTDVSSDDILFQNNVGVSSQSSLILIGQRPQDVGRYTNYGCSNIVFDNVNGSGMNKTVYISSIGASNPVSNITLENSVIDAAGSNRNEGAIQIISEVNGTISKLSFKNYTVRNYAETALMTQGNVTQLSFDHGQIYTPSNGHFPSMVLSDTSQASITNSTIGSHIGDALQIGPNDSAGAQQPVSQVTVTGNVFNGIGNGFAAVRMFNVNLGNVATNTMNSAAGATSATGIFFSSSGPKGPGTTNSAATGNNLSGISGTAKIVFAPNQGNSLQNNQE